MSYAVAVRRLLWLLLFSVAFASAQQGEPERLLRSAVEAQQRGDLPTAIREYRKLLKLKPQRTMDSMRETKEWFTDLTSSRER